jgi:Lrp/AsnC family leucine-responsive transcriptional regulator
MIDNVDLQLLGALEEDGRQSFASLAEATGLTKTPCWSRVQALERGGIIKGFRADLDAAALGLRVTAFVLIIIDAGKRNVFEEAVSDDCSILECYTIAGEADYLAKIVSRDVDALDGLLRYHLTLLPGVIRTQTIIALKTIKRHGSLTKAARESRSFTPARAHNAQ